MNPSMALLAVVLETSPFGFHPGSVQKPGYANNGFYDAQQIGVRWAREGVYAFWFLVQPDRSRNEYDFARYDQQWSAVPTTMRILANIAPQGPKDEDYCSPGSYLPVDREQYLRFVKAVVERYDGDGIDDMPGLLNPILYWQVGNEPVNAIRGFADLQTMTYDAIKEVCANCTVLIGGAPGMPPAADYIAQFDHQYRPILDALHGKSVDVMDVHWYGNATGDYRGIRDVLDHVRSVLRNDGFGDIPIWITEMGTYSGDPDERGGDRLTFDFQTERQQASDLFKRFVFPLSHGVKKVFPAFGLMEGFKYDRGYFDFTGLIYDGWGSYDRGMGTRKLSWYTYKKMTEILEGADWTSAEIIQDSDDVFNCHLQKDRQPLYVLWWDSSSGLRNVQLTGVQAGTLADHRGRAGRRIGGGGHRLHDCVSPDAERDAGRRAHSDARRQPRRDRAGGFVPPACGQTGALNYSTARKTSRTLFRRELINGSDEI